MKKTDKIFIAGHSGMLGSALLRACINSGYTNLITRLLKELNLLNTEEVEDFFSVEKPDIVIMAAAKVGGIKANIKYPADFLFENLVMQNNIIHQSYLHGVKKLCFIGSSCIYPKECPQPMKEEYLMTGPLEPTNEGYSIAKIAGYKLAYFYSKQYGMNTISVMPCNLYGTNDNFNLEDCHVLSALVKRFADAVKENTKEITLWGTGMARREFLHVDDCAKAILFLIEHRDSPEIINIGSGQDISIKELAQKIACKTGFKGKISWDTSKPDGMLRKCLDISKITRLGFKPEISLDEGINQMIAEYRKLQK